MTLNPPFTIRIEKPETALTETMNEMRTWLDRHEVQLIEFKIAMTGFPSIAFDLQFRSEDDAVCLSGDLPSPRWTLISR